MEYVSKFVLLFKALNDNMEITDNYEMLLENKGFITSFVPVLNFEYTNSVILKEALERPTDYSGIIFTSPRAVKSVTKCTNAIDISTWNHSKIFVVGEATQKLLQSELNLSSSGEGTGNANNLADFIIEHHISDGFTKPFLFPCGNLKSDTLQDKLHAANIKVDQIIVYETVVNEELETTFANVTSNCTKLPEFLVYFSPSGVKFTIPLFKKLNIDSTAMKCIAIGPSTAKYMKENNFNVFSVAVKPTADCLLAAIESKNR